MFKKYLLLLLGSILILLFGIFFYVNMLYNSFRNNYIGGWEDCVNQTGLLIESIK